MLGFESLSRSLRRTKSPQSRGFRGSGDRVVVRVGSCRTFSVPPSFTVPPSLRAILVAVARPASGPRRQGSKRCYEAVTTRAAKVARSRLVILTSAGEPAHWSKALLDAAYQDELWRVHEIGDPAPFCLILHGSKANATAPGELFPTALPEPVNRWRGP